ncbi:ectoine synthase [Lentibacillus halophilus]|uniref:L-ectoine synthase n=1 Tax=Lentibacillus halophilus TaxID=295065 RepID=A0ABN0ZC54_9BACI
MIVKKLKDILDTKNDIYGYNWNSRRILLKKDGMGYSMADTVVKKGTETFIWYKNHYETCYCIEGEGELELADENGKKTGEIYKIRPETMYALNGNEKHYLRATSEDMRLICVFNPALTGNETHDKDGTYPLLD